ncbi:MAG: VWA domain-containing protein [Bdellovibrionales bacterium]|nr:VWA domain-containing protein [Bdellovibrionales bacterium]
MKIGLGKYAMRALLTVVVPLALFSSCKQEYSLVQGTTAQNGGNPPVGPGNPTPNPTCTETIDTTTANLRIMFMVDNSGSTFPSGNDPGTDPNFHYRAQTIKDFLTQYGTKTNFTYSFGYFSGTSAKVYDMNSNSFKAAGSITANNFFGNSTQLNTALTNYQNITPSGNTPYGAAFNATKTEVIADEGAHGATYQYIMIFMSDGKPTDANSNIQSWSQISNLVPDLLAAAGSSNSLAVGTVYFGPANDSTAISNLSQMATQGGGQFVNTNTTTNFTINDVISIPGCH